MSVLDVRQKVALRRLDTWLGRLEIVASDDFLFFVGLGDDSATRFLKTRGLHGWLRGYSNSLIEEAAAQIDEYFKGERRAFNLPLRFFGTEFQKRVWSSVMSIPYGKSRSYKWVAERVGCSSPRPVGGALSANHLLIVVPCHRVVGSDGGLGGFSCGLPVKRKLLTHEAGRIAGGK